MTVAQLAALLAASACFTSYGWGLARFFRTPSKDARGHRLITWATAASVLAHYLALAFFYRGSGARFAAAMALYAVSLLLFWWCVAVNRAQPLSLAFSTDRPHHLITAGPYAVIRHPFYLSYMLCWIAGMVASGRWILAVTVAVMGWIYRRAAIAEEAKFAASPLAEAYRLYAAATGRFLPCLWSRRPRA
ncbi:MAG: isoprenylcysteine carboxylmethyltransferase family protein [Alphaproteobacteria bacterium]|nr:isoprenylcysteine carboxylmethyltransferase family protein [Alphaproteobacteria bacterium]